jgi:hypothetical protein|tara:strand:- start:1119 stop:1289 length:171 start_codon:yes stop_codon:yes gene_type:complete
MKGRSFTADEDGYILDIPKIPIDEDFTNMAFEAVENAILDSYTADDELSFNGEHYD